MDISLRIQPLTHSVPIVKILENYTNDNIHRGSYMSALFYWIY